MRLDCFKSYDVRGRVGETFGPEIAEAIGIAFVGITGAETVIVGHDARASSPEISAALANGLAGAGADVVDIGLCGTEEVYHATARSGAGGGIMVTASHNPIDWNGMKLVGAGSRPLTPEVFGRIRDRVATAPRPGSRRGKLARQSYQDDYADHLASLVDPVRLAPLRIVANAGNGTAGPALDAVLERLSDRGARLDIRRQFHDPDPSFPNGIPNPLLPENRSATAERVIAEAADLGAAWDGDFDRCFFFDEEGRFADGEYIVALMARMALERRPASPIVHDPRIVYAIRETIRAAGGSAVACPTGHAFLKAAMRKAGAPYGGEMSAHHYFEDFHYCDSGILPFLRMLELLSAGGRPLGEVLGDMRHAFPSSGEINFRIADIAAAIGAIEAAYTGGTADVDRLDGLSVDFGTWRFNLRASNTEPLLRLNVETRGDRDLLERKTDEMSSLIARYA